MSARNRRCGKSRTAAEPAITMYEVEQVFRPVAAKSLKPSLFPNDRKLPCRRPNSSLLRLTPKTGERIIAGASVHDRFPIVGDTMYGGQIFEAEGFRFERQALHAYQITFVHPGTLKEMTLTAPRPPDIEKLLEHLTAGGGRFFGDFYRML